MRIIPRYLHKDTDANAVGGKIAISLIMIRLEISETENGQATEKNQNQKLIKLVNF